MENTTLRQNLNVVSDYHYAKVKLTTTVIIFE